MQYKHSYSDATRVRGTAAVTRDRSDEVSRSIEYLKT